jgi:hypothetical protein
MNFAIGIPTLNRADLLVPSLLKYINDFPGVKIFVLDNGNQDIESSLQILRWPASGKFLDLNMEIISNSKS